MLSAEPPIAGRTQKIFIALAMLGTVAVTAAVVRWDEKREEDAAFEDFAVEQSRMARAVASGLSGRLDSARQLASLARPEDRPWTGTFFEVHRRTMPHGEGDERPLDFTIARDGGETLDVELSLPSLLKEVSSIERPGEVVLLVRPPGKPRLVSTDAREVDAQIIEDALTASSASLRLDRSDATRLGLPARAAFAGLARFDSGPFGRWGVAVVASASHERAREFRSRLRLVATSAIAGGLVFLFGAMSLRRQARDLDFARELALVDLQRRLDDRLVRASRVAMMGTFATGVAHEISTPLGIIVGRAEQLETRFKGDEKTTKNARTILEQADRIRGVVRGFLNLARGGDPVLARVDPEELARGAMRLVQHRFEKAEVSLAGELPTRGLAIHCDGLLLEHALVNLLLNACEACERGGHVVLSVDAREDRVEIVVRDDGSGIAPELAARAIEPFFTTKPAGQGTGLGLAITNEIVKAHRGTLRIEANEPLGTRVTISLPRADEEVGS